MTHSEAVLSGLKGHLLGVAHSLRGVVAVRSENVAKSAERRQLFGGGSSARDLGRPLDVAPRGGGGDAGGVGGRAGGEGGARGGGGWSGGSGGGDAIITMGGSSAAAAAAAAAADSNHAFAAVTQAQLSRDPELAFLSARAQDVAGLEATINELGTLFGRLASVIAEQGAQVRTRGPSHP